MRPAPDGGKARRPRVNMELVYDWAGYEELNRRAFVAYHGDNPARLRRSMAARAAAERRVA